MPWLNRWVNVVSAIPFSLQSVGKTIIKHTNDTDASSRDVSGDLGVVLTPCTTILELGEREVGRIKPRFLWNKPDLLHANLFWRFSPWIVGTSLVSFDWGGKACLFSPGGVHTVLTWPSHSVTQASESWFYSFFGLFFQDKVSICSPG